MIPFPVVGVARPNFLILTPICISLGLASVMLSGSDFQWSLFAVVFVGALMAHISVNALNEYADFQSGLDFKTERTPFSGGSGTLVIQPRLAPYALVIGIASLVITLVCGLYLFQQSGWGLLPIGILGVSIITFYTGWINRHRLLVLIAPGLSFGPLMVVGTHYALAGSYSPLALLLSLIPFFLVNNLLLLNQIPDVEADRSIGRDNYAIAWEPARSAWIYAGFGILAYLVVIAGVVTQQLPVTALLGLLTLGLTYRIFVGVRNYQGDIDRLIPYLGRNVAVTLATPLLVVIGVIMDRMW
ncbi:MAG: prenyltransferase [Candidatus Thiodiazotropha sp. (ex Dulcina madagascariensis)]|nr:prenyltransferase [Candidatus Thiodiazotropha sp. (ex Epidulcina cf. delphinae)]MCU7923366.1 prenyltransferase [Candidatus Thiodiazotropha sp. (ex Dulcina madagascariensis)]MCU7928485.1 prenyltransferase [Candidatus Thiodiazotropha sp. (ex Dulcina madagascariensis)]